MRLGLLHQNTEQFNVLEVTSSGRDFLKNRARIEVNKPLVTARLESREAGTAKEDDGSRFVRSGSSSPGCETGARRSATERGVPAYVIFHDSTLQAIAHEKPTSMAALSRIAGLGERKLATYGDQILAVIRASE